MKLGKRSSGCPRGTSAPKEVNKATDIAHQAAPFAMLSTSSSQDPTANISSISSSQRSDFIETIDSRSSHSRSSQRSDLTETIDSSEVTGMESFILKQAAQLICDRTLFLNPFPKPGLLSRWVVEVWCEAEEILSVTHKQSKKARSLVSIQHAFTALIHPFDDLTDL